MFMDRSEPRSSTPPLEADVFAQHPSKWMRTVTGLLDEQFQLCGRLEQLGAEQSGHVDAGRTEGLLAVLSQRQIVLDRVVEINGLLEPFRANRESAMTRLRPVDRDSLQQRIDQIADTVDRVRRRDDEDRKQLESQRRSVADELSNLTRLRGAAAAYAGSAPASARTHDHRG